MPPMTTENFLPQPLIFHSSKKHTEEKEKRKADTALHHSVNHSGTIHRSFKCKSKNVNDTFPIFD